jgi:hypothetical protein
MPRENKQEKYTSPKKGGGKEETNNVLVIFLAEARGFSICT